jgi:hypothetical protein
MDDDCSPVYSMAQARAQKRDLDFVHKVEHIM